MEVSSMPPSKRRKIVFRKAISQPTSGNAISDVRTQRSASAPGDLPDVPDAPDADHDAEPEVLMCPITRTVFRDPVVVVESGQTYERSAILTHFRRNRSKDPLTGLALSSTRVVPNWAVRRIVQDWLDKHPDATPDGWDSRELLEPSNDDGTLIIDDEGDIRVLRTWRAMCPALQEKWPEDEQPEHWEGVTMEHGRVVALELEEFGLTGAVPAEIGQLTSLKKLDLSDNRLTSVPAEIGQLTSLEVLGLYNNQLTGLPAEIGQLTSLKTLELRYNQLTSVPAEIGQLTSLRELWLNNNRLTSVPAEIGQLTSLEGLWIHDNQLTSVPAEIGQLTSLEWLNLGHNQLTSLPAEVRQLTLLESFHLRGNQLTSVPAAIRKLTRADCDVYLDRGVKVDK